jgi:hypothetical protein
MTPEDLWERYPQLFHVAMAAGWEGIRRNGLWSAEELTRLLGWSPQNREKWLTRRRHQVGGYEDGQLGRVTFRDHRGIPKAGLGHALVGVTEAEWYRELNRRVFFYVGRRNANRLVAAYDEEQVIFTVDTERLLRAGAERVAVATINTGYAFRRSVKRGLGTFVPLADFPSEQAGQIVEVTVVGGIKEIAELTATVERPTKAGHETLWARGQ